MAPAYPDDWRGLWPTVRAQLNGLQEGHYKHIREMASIPDQVQDLNQVNDEQARALVNAYRSQMSVAQQRAASSPRNAEQQPHPRRGAKRSSTSPGEDDINHKDSSPPNKRLRPSPPSSASEIPGTAPMNLGGAPQMNGAPGARPPQLVGTPNGMHPPGAVGGQSMPPGMNPLGTMHVQQMTGAGGLPPGTVMGPGGQPMMMRSPAQGGGMPGHMQQPGMQIQQQPHPDQLQRRDDYKSSMANIHANKFSNPHMYQLQAPDGPGAAGPSSQPMNAAAAAARGLLQQQQGPKYGTGVTAPPGSPESKPQNMGPPQAPTPKLESSEHQNGIDAPSPSPGRTGLHQTPQLANANTNGPQPYPPITGIDPRSASTPGGGGGPTLSHPSPALQPAPPPPAASAPPPATPSSSSISAPPPAPMMFDLGSADMSWPGLADFDMGMGGVGMDMQPFDDFSSWINTDAPGGDVVGGI